MIEKAILSAIIFSFIYVFLCYVIIKIFAKVKEENDNEGDEVGDIRFAVIVLFMVLSAIMLMYTNYWITIIASIVIILRIGVDNKYRVTEYSLLILAWCLTAWFSGALYNIVNVAHPAEQHIETEITNIVYGENIKVEDLSQDTIYIEKIVLQKHYNLIEPLGAENYYRYLEDEDSYQYYYKIEEENGKTKSISKIIPSNDVKIQYVKDRKKAMMKKIVTETYYEKPFFGIEVPMLKIDIETKYEFYIPIELLEVVEIK